MQYLNEVEWAQTKSKRQIVNVVTVNVRMIKNSEVRQQSILDIIITGLIWVYSVLRGRLRKWRSPSRRGNELECFCSWIHGKSLWRRLKQVCTDDKLWEEKVKRARCHRGGDRVGSTQEKRMGSGAWWRCVQNKITVQCWLAVSCSLTTGTQRHS